MTIMKKTLIATSAFMLGTTALADGNDKKDKMNAGNVPAMELSNPFNGLGIVGTPQWTIDPNNPLSWSFLTVPFPWGIPGDPALDDMPGGGKGMPVYDANDTSKIIGYVKMPARKKPAGPVHCVIKETGLLAKSVDDCEAAGGTVAK